FAALTLCAVVLLFATPHANPVNKSVFTGSSKPETVEADQPVTYLTKRRVQVVSTTSTTTLWLIVGYALLVAWRVIRLLRFWVRKERLRRLTIHTDLTSVVAPVAQRCSSILKTRNVVVTQSSAA